MVERHWVEVERERERPQRSRDKEEKRVPVIFPLKGYVCVSGPYSVAPPAVCLTCISCRFLRAERLPVAAGSTHSHQQGASHGGYEGASSPGQHQGQFSPSGQWWYCR